MAMRSVDAGALDGFEDGERRIVSIGTRQIAVVRWKERFYAMQNVCPHQGAPVCGAIVPSLRSSGGGYVSVDRSSPVVQCTWHRWEFDLGTGRALCDPSLTLRLYPTHVEGGRLIVDI